MSIIDVAAAIIWRNGRFLVARRTANQHLAGYWEFPGGKRRQGESWKRCLARELREELGLQVWVGQCLQAVEHHYAARTVRIVFYRCEIIGGQLRAREGQTLRWVRGFQLRKLKFPTADGSAIRHLAGTGLAKRQKRLGRQREWIFTGDLC